MIKIENKEKIDPGEKPYDLFLEFFTTLPATLNEDNSVQCKKGKLRSYKDLLEIFRYYYPEYVGDYSFNVTLRTLIKKHIINCVYCGDLGTITYFPYNFKDRGYHTYRTMVIPQGNILYFNKQGILGRYGGYSKSDYERHPIVKETLDILGVKDPIWD